jgi:hypothetical protein
MRKAYEQSPAAVRKWLDEQYPVIAACAKVEGAEIHWGDETRLRTDDRQALEQLCRDITRPALANDRV